MSLTGILLGIINIAIVAAIFLLIGAIVLMIVKWFGYSIDPLVQKFFLLVVLLIVLYMTVALLLGLPTWRIIPMHAMMSPHMVAASLR